MVTTAIILAGGLGTRLKGTVPNLPKPMAPINNRPFLEYQIDYWISQGITKFILSIGYLNEVIINHFGDKYKNVSIKYSIESTPLGTGGGLMLALKNQVEPVLVLNGDTFFKVDLEELSSFHFISKSKWTLSLFRTNQTTRYLNIKQASNGEILELKPEVKLSISSNLANGGVYLVEPSVFNLLDYKKGEKVSLEDDILSNLVDNSIKLFGKEFEGFFIDIGVPEDYYRAQEFLSTK
ncbi:nucleotidyltransferase family protein [Candidatus Thioglobus sp.]|nr:nucleotidyltransferase family protein [Candidatus Thioglobus sp.]